CTTSPGKKLWVPKNRSGWHPVRVVSVLLWIYENHRLGLELKFCTCFLVTYLLLVCVSSDGFFMLPNEDGFEEQMIHDEEHDNDNGQQAAESTEVLGTPESGKRKDAPESSTTKGKASKELKVIIPRSPHLATCKEYQTYMANKSQQVIKGNGSKQAASISEPMYREATNEMLVLGELPLSFVESVAWRHFSSRVNLYRPHSRRTPSRDIVQLYVKKKALLKKWINSNKQRVSLTTDIWVAPNTSIYMVITAHFIDAFWMLKKLIIGFNTLLDCLAEWEIKKVFCVTADNATTNTLALKKFQREFRLVSNDAFVLDGDYMHIRCIAHIINLIVRDGLHDLSKNLEAIRNGVSYVRSSHVKQKSFELRVNLGKLKRISLTLNVKTRWSSTYTMLTNALKYRVAFDKMLIEDRLVKFLVIFYNSTLIVSASTSLNAHKCYGEIVTIERNLSFLTNSRDDGLKNKAADMLKKFLKYWDGMNNINKMLIIATVFDPTKNLKFAKMCFEKLYGEDSVDFKAMGDYVFYVLDLVYKEYAAEKLGLVPKTKQHQSPEIPKKMDLVDDLGYQRMDMAYKEMVANNTDEVVRREL
ncbi:hypothetical protein CARUB_v10007067mg, partial [Capsella rubella]